MVSSKVQGQRQSSRCGIRARRRPGFTLIELMIVVTIIGLLAVMATLRLSGLTGKARFRQAVERMQSLDAQMRARAVRFAEPSQLQLTIDRSSMGRVFGEDQEEAPNITLSGNVEVARVRSPTRDARTGQMTIHYTPAGTSDTWAVQLSASGHEPTWLLFAGLTGQVTELERERDVAEILKASRSSRSDTR